VKQFKTLLFRCLFLFYLTSSYFAATHFHDNSLNSNSDCKICIVVKNLNSGDAPVNNLDILACDGCYEPIAFHIKSVEKTILKGFNANAPPKLS